MMAYFRRVLFIRNWLGINADSTIEDALVALEGHPYAEWLNVFRHKRRSVAIASFSNELTIDDMNMLTLNDMLSHLPDDCRIDHLDRGAVSNALQSSIAKTGSHLLHHASWHTNPEKRLRAVQSARTEAPHAPMRHALLIRTGLATDQQISAATKRFATHAVVAEVLCDLAIDQGDYVSALKHARQVVKASAQIHAYMKLAELQLWTDGVPAWLESMETALGLPDYSLGHATINCTIAGTYMHSRRYQDALPYARAAATSGASWARDQLAHCLIALGQKQEAIRLLLTNDSHYEHTSAPFFLACYGLIDDAKRIWAKDTEPRLNNNLADKPTYVLRKKLEWALASGQDQLAIDLIQQASEQEVKALHPIYPIWCALAADTVGDERTRDEMFGKCRHLDEDNVWVRFAALLSTVTDEGHLPIEDFLAWQKDANYNDGELGVWITWLQLNRGKQPFNHEAIIRILSGDNYEGFGAIAHRVLRDTGVPIEQTHPKNFDYMHRLEPPEPTIQKTEENKETDPK